jgi:glycosyltransferase involved in cell wall biosynthesis
MASAQTEPVAAVVGQQPLPISLAVITLNEEQNLARCLESVRGLVSETVVIDSGSTDKTAAVAKQYGAVFEVHNFRGNIAQHAIAMQRCSQPWVLSLDADEALSPDLAGSIRKLFARGDPKQNGFWVNRRTFFLGGWINHAWYPDWLLRLVRKTQAEWCGVEPHGTLEVRGATQRISGDLLHYPWFRDSLDHVSRAIKYAHTAADAYAAAGRRAHWYDLVLSPAAVVFKYLFVKQGWRDGWRGWLILISKLINVLAKYAFLLEKQHTSADSARHP